MSDFALLQLLDDLATITPRLHTIVLRRGWNPSYFVPRRLNILDATADIRRVHNEVFRVKRWLDPVDREPVAEFHSISRADADEAEVAGPQFPQVVSAQNDGTGQALLGERRLAIGRLAREFYRRLFS